VTKLKNGNGIDYCLMILETGQKTHLRARWYFVTQASMWMPSPAALTHSNIWPCSDLDFDPMTLKAWSVHLTVV